MKHVVTLRVYVDSKSELLKSDTEAKGLMLLDWIEEQLKHKDVETEIIGYAASVAAWKATSKPTTLIRVKK